MLSMITKAPEPLLVDFDVTARCGAQRVVGLAYKDVGRWIKDNSGSWRIDSIQTIPLSTGCTRSIEFSKVIILLSV